MFFVRMRRFLLTLNRFIHFCVANSNFLVKKMKKKKISIISKVYKNRDIRIKKYAANLLKSLEKCLTNAFLTILIQIKPFFS